MRQQDKNLAKSIANKVQSLPHDAFYFLLYALIILGISWPAPQFLSQKLIGNNVDNWIFYWNNWWIKYALSNGESIFETQKLFYPTGTSLVAHSHSIFNSLIAIPIDLMAGPVVAYNLIILLGLWLSGVGMFLLVCQLTRSKEAAFLAGLVFCISPISYHPGIGPLSFKRYSMVALLCPDAASASRNETVAVCDRNGRFCGSYHLVGGAAWAASHLVDIAIFGVAL